MKLAAACSSAIGFRVESVAVDVREVCLGCWLMALCPSTHYPKGTRKIVLERKKESMRSAWFGQLVAKSLGGSIDSRKEIDLWLLHHPQFRRKADREKDSSRKTKKGTFYT